jgi:two-component system sensor histidine kinase YesM
MRGETMLPAKIYRKYFKNNVFIKIIFLFSIVAVVTIIAFSYLMFFMMSQSIVQRQLEVQKRVAESVSNYIGQKYESVQSMLRDVYRDGDLMGNTSYLLEHPYEDYVKYRLDQYFSANKSPIDTVQYFRNKVEDDSDIRSLLLYSATEQQLYGFNAKQQFQRFSTNAAHSFVPDAMYQEDSPVSGTNIWVRRSIGLSDVPMFAIRAPINNKTTLLNIGQLLVYFDSARVWDSMGNDKDDFKGTIVALAANGDVLFDSSGQYYGKKYPYAEQVHATSTEGEETQGMFITRLLHSQGGFTVLSAVPKQEISVMYRGLRNTIILICAVCILFAVFTTSLFIGNFARRTHSIIKFTRRVKNGDLTARISDIKDDELGQISKSFNDMLEELNLYIDRVYKAEIKQKHTEIAALEAKINPHFLYNTLEVIRMRAISQGAGDVGEMIYSLSVLFKGYVHTKPKHTLQDELEACRLYLELFRIRYRDRISYKLECDEELEGKVVMKMSLQPIIENYILHGMQTQRTDNEIGITVDKEGKMLRVTVTDNGNGISPERLEQLQAVLSHSDENTKSFGLRSIHERLKLLYGEPYGLELYSELGVGTKVIVRFPDLGEEEPIDV